MANRFIAAMARMRQRLDGYASDEVTYRLGADSVTFPATLGGRLLKITDVNGVVKMLRTDADFTFAAGNLVLSGVQVEPAKGAFIDVTDADGDTLRYQILPPGNDEPAWRYSDPQRTMIRVHAKLKQTV